MANNTGFRQVESLMTVKTLKERYLFGIEIVDGEGNEIPDRVMQSYINNAVSILEHDLDIAIMPRSLDSDCPEEKDYHANDYWNWGYLQLNHYPVISIEKIVISYLKDNSANNIELLEIPQAWIRLNKATGVVRLVPNNKFPSNLQVGAGGAFFPELFKRQGHVPDLWAIEYTHGFEPGKIPVLINTAIGLLASIFALSVAGNLVLGAGIAGSSLSLDGLSQSIQTTQSAENSAYSATRKEYADQLFGQRDGDPNSIVRILRNYYKGQYVNII